MTMRKSITTAAAAGLVGFAALGLHMNAAAQADAKPRHTAEEIARSKPSGTLEVSAEQVRLILGGASGRGTLYYGGKSYPFTMKGAHRLFPRSP
jgi:hypothetical protein